MTPNPQSLETSEPNEKQEQHEPDWIDYNTGISASRVEDQDSNPHDFWEKFCEIRSLSRLNTRLSIVYRILLEGIRIIRIPLLLIAVLCSLYYVDTSFIWDPIISFYLLFNNNLTNSPYCLFLLGSIGIGFEKANELIDKTITYPRVSARSQEGGTSLSGQKDTLQSEKDRLDAKHNVTIGDEWESANTMLRENIDEIVDIVKESDDTYCLMLKSVDRLSRADPLEAVVFMWIMREHDVILYFDDLGYFDLTDPYQQLLVFFELIRSRKEYLNILENSDEGIEDTKEEGRFPAPAPYGFEKDEDGALVLDEIQAEIIQRGAVLILNGDAEYDVEKYNMQAALDRLEEEYGQSQTPSYSTFLDIYRKEIYTGRLPHEGEAVGECPQIISEETFEELQSVLEEEISQPQKQKDEKLDHALKEVVDEFGIKASLQMFENILKPRCPDCGDDVITWGGAERWGELVNNYRCVNHPKLNGEDEEENENESENDTDNQCEFEGPLLSGEVLREWESSIPLTCSACRAYLDDEEWKECPTKIDAIEQECSNCGTTNTVDLPMNKFERRSILPEHILSFFKDSADDSSDSNIGNERSTDTNTDDSSTIEKDTQESDITTWVD